MAKIASTQDSYGSHEAARIVIKDGSAMTASGRKRIATWMRRQAAFLEKHGDEMAKTYRARWMWG